MCASEEGKINVPFSLRIQRLGTLGGAWTGLNHNRGFQGPLRARGLLLPAVPCTLQALHVSTPNSCARVCMHTHRQAHTHTRTDAHTHAYTYRHTYRSTQMHTSSSSSCFLSQCGPQPKHLGVFIPLSFCSLYSLATRNQSRAKALSRPPSPPQSHCHSSDPEPSLAWTAMGTSYV